MMNRRAMRSIYMHWAKNQASVRFHLASSEVPHFELDRLPLSIADLELDGASRHRYLPLREAIAARRGVTADNVVLANGTSMANFLAMAALIGPGDEVLVEAPAYEPMVAAASYLGGEIRSFTRPAAEGFRLDAALVEAALTPRIRLIVITNLHNPTSAFADEAVLAEIGRLAERNGARVLVDEIYLDAAFAAAPRTALRLGDVFVTTGSLTKVYGLSGIRCGWILASADVAERMWRLNELMGVARPHAAERLGMIALAHLDEIAAPLRPLLDTNREIVRSFLAARNDLDIRVPEAGIVLFPAWRGGDVDALNALLRSEYDTSIVPGRFFGCPEHFRLGIGGDSRLLEEGLSRLGAALDELARR